MARRGQRRSFIGEGAPAVLIYFNEVPLPPLGSLIPTYDVSSIQVLKGPQGTLFGRNATAGGILIYSAPPTYKLEGYLDAHLGNFMDRGFEGAINLPIVDQKIALRLAGQIARRDRSEEHTSELQSLMRISYAVFCLKKKKTTT